MIRTRSRAHKKLTATHRSYEFRQNEFVTSLKSVSLESKSTRSGLRDFIAVGTAVARAEDLTIKGGVSWPGVFLHPEPTPDENPHTRRSTSLKSFQFSPTRTRRD